MKDTSNTPTFWKEIMLKASKVDYGSPVPELDELFLSVWGAHYHAISRLTMPVSDFLEIGSGFGVLAAGMTTLSRRSCITVEHPSRPYFHSKSYGHFLRDNAVHLTGCDLRQGLPFGTASFSTIYLCDVIEHLYFDDVRTLLSEILRVLVPEGELVVSTPNLNRLGNMIRMFRGYSPNPPLYPESSGETFGHIREFAPRELDYTLEQHGFTIEKRIFTLNPYFTSETFGAENIFSSGQTRWINRLNRWLSRIFPILGDEIYILARKKNRTLTGNE